MSPKKTPAQFAEELKMVNSNITLLEDYIDSKNKIKYQCKVCGLTWAAYPGNLLKGYGCPKCAGQYRRTPAEFVNDLALVNPNIKLVGEYTNTRTKTTFECCVCGHTWDASPGDLLSKKGCPLCGRKKAANTLRKSHEDFIRELKEINPNVLVLGTYSSFVTPIGCQCMTCGLEWKPTAGSLLAGHGCPKCGERKQKTSDEFIDEISNLHPTIEILNDYTNSQTKVHCKCRICNFEWDALPPTLRKGRGCPKCSKTYKRSSNDFINDIKVVNPNITIIGEYVNTQVKVECRCLICNNTWFARPSKLLRGQGCPECKKKKIGDALRKTQQQFIEEMKKANSDINILGNYSTSTSHILCSCKICGKQWLGIPNNLLRGEGCPECKNKKIGDLLRKPHHQFVEELFTQSPQIRIIGEYQSDTIPIECQCATCNHIWSALPSNLLKGSGCPSCAHTQTSFVEKVFFLALERSLGVGEVLERDRSAIGKEIDIYIPSLKVGIEPGSWYWHKPRFDKDIEKHQLAQQQGIKLIILYDTFNEDRNKLNLDCNFITCPENLGMSSNRKILKTYLKKVFDLIGVDYLLNGAEEATLFSDAKKAAYKKGTADFVLKMEQINPNIEILGEYEDIKTKIACKCKICGNTWSSTPGHLIHRKQGCPVCNSAKKAVINLDTGEIYESASEAARQLGTSSNSVGIVCRGLAKTCKGFRWAYTANLSDEEKKRYKI